VSNHVDERKEGLSPSNFKAVADEDKVLRFANHFVVF